MTIQNRAIMGVLLAAAWFGLIGPHIEAHIHASTLEGPKPFSLQNLRDRVSQDTGEPDESLTAAMAALASLQMAEEERISAMWSLLDDSMVHEANARIPTLPPPQYAVDPRFFEPLVPEIIRRTIERYGASTTPLGPVTITQLDGERDDQLRTILSAVHYRMIDEEHAGALLQAAYDLLELQMQRMELEGKIREEHAETLGL